MRVERTPITVYDFFGYFIPGFIFLSLMFYTFEEHFILGILKKISHTKTVTDDILFGVFFIFFSYITGHILSYMSHWIDKKVKKKFYQQKTGVEFCGCFFFQGLKRKVFNPDKINKYVKNACVKYILENGGLNRPDAKVKNDPSESAENLGAQNSENDFHSRSNDENEINQLILSYSEGELGQIKKILALHLNDPALSPVTYNMLVLSGMFRTITMVFLIYIGCLLMGVLFFYKNLIFYTSQDFTFSWVLVISIIVTVSSFMIYCKFLRRHIEKEEASIVFYDFKTHKKPNSCTASDG